MQPMVVAHRGASTHRAEHTLTLDRMSELDYASWHLEPAEHAEDLVTTHRIAPRRPRPETGVLTLEALLGLVADARPGTKPFVETKHPVRYAGLVEARLVALLSRYGLAKPSSKEDSAVVVMSFSARAIRRLHEHAPALPTVLLLQTMPPARRDGSLPAFADHSGPDIAQLRADPDYVARCARHGHGTYCWTVDEPADVLLCRQLGVRFLATNSPVTTRAILDANPGR